MIKLTDILNELEINNPNITPEKAHKYYNDNIDANYVEFGVNKQGWEDYKQLCQPYCKKYDINKYIVWLNEFKKLSQSDLNTFYKQMRSLVRKYIGKIILINNRQYARVLYYREA